MSTKGKKLQAAKMYWNAHECLGIRKNLLRSWQALGSPDSGRFSGALAATPIGQHAWSCPNFKTCKTSPLPIEMLILIFLLLNRKCWKSMFWPSWNFMIFPWFSWGELLGAAMKIMKIIAYAYQNLVLMCVQKLVKIRKTSIVWSSRQWLKNPSKPCLLYTSDAADE